jgi:formylglycine-generating enzyme required for sulfatase activity
LPARRLIPLAFPFLSALLPCVVLPGEAPVPEVDGGWWTVAGDPDLGPLTDPRQQPVDFGIWRAADGTWQLWSCIRRTRCGGNTRLFFRWQGKRLTDPDWQPMGIAMTADPALGETSGGLQAPFVFKVDDLYHLFYGDWEHICRAASRDGKSFERNIGPSGATGLFGEGPGANTRDPCVLRDENLYYAYYTAHPGGKGAVYCRVSSDLDHWSHSIRVARGGQAGSGASSAECPFVLWHERSRSYYLFRTQVYGENARTSVYRSENPLDFGWDDDSHFLGTLPVAAPEIIHDGGEEFIASLLPSLKGIRIARLKWTVKGPGGGAAVAELPSDKSWKNSLGMALARIEPGTFLMGTAGDPADSDPDERPAHKVTISRPFYLGAFEVTNAQYEAYDPGHRALRGKLGFSKLDDEAVVFVSWQDAVSFCKWLSNKEGRPYRLPTEAEWEYACRAGTTTRYSTGDDPPAGCLLNPGNSWFPDPERSRKDQPVSLAVEATPPNGWGIHGMHGNVEEWCADWYGAYEAKDQVDPTGGESGDFRVTRGGSHSTTARYLRSANRLATLPEDRSWLIGFRVAMGESPTVSSSSPPVPVPVPVPVPGPSRDVARPYFQGPRPYVKILPDSQGPMFSHHNHDPAIVDCPNGDLLAIWYSCLREDGRELSILQSRLRHGTDEWEPASLFWDVPDRNDHAPALWRDGSRIYHFNGLSAAATWGNLAVVMRTSDDSGITWSKARLVLPEHGLRHQPVESIIKTRDGAIVLPCDAVTGGNGGTAIHLSLDGGATWTDPGGKTAGIHAGIVELADGRLLALGRGDEIEGRMARSLSADRGKTWTTSASPFSPIGGGQRLALLRLRQGPILLASFARAMPIRDASGTDRPVDGLFVALSLDEGETWPVRRLMSDDGAPRKVETTDGEMFTLDQAHGEPKGYLSICQAEDGVVHLISSRQHYAFNLAWVERKSTP